MRKGEALLCIRENVNSARERSHEGWCLAVLSYKNRFTFSLCLNREKNQCIRLNKVISLITRRGSQLKVSFPEHFKGIMGMTQQSLI